MHHAQGGQVDSTAAYTKAWKRRQADRDAALVERKQRMILAARECAEVLKRDYHATHVILIGSLTGHTTFHDMSDIDLYVVGLADPMYFKALNRLYAIAKSFTGEDVDIDLVTDDCATRAMLESIDHYGVELP